MVLSPADIRRLFVGPTEKDLGIRRLEVPGLFSETADHIKVLLPKNFSPTKTYPVLYILPVTESVFDQWWHNGIIVAAQEGIADHYQVICVYPEFKTKPWFADHPSDSRYQQESFLIQSVIPFVDRSFSTQRGSDGRFLIGFSKAGFGAFSLMLRHPELFAGAASWDAPMLFKNLDSPGAGLREAFQTDENYMAYFIPALLAKKHVYLQEASKRFVLMGHGYLHDDVASVHDMMNFLSIPHIYDKISGRNLFLQ